MLARSRDLILVASYPTSHMQPLCKSQLRVNVKEVTLSKVGTKRTNLLKQPATRSSLTMRRFITTNVSIKEICSKFYVLQYCPILGDATIIRLIRVRTRINYACGLLKVLVEKGRKNTTWVKTTPGFYPAEFESIIPIVERGDFLGSKMCFCLDKNLFFAPTKPQKRGTSEVGPQ